MLSVPPFQTAPPFVAAVLSFKVQLFRVMDVLPWALAIAPPLVALVFSVKVQLVKAAVPQEDCTTEL